MQPRSSRSKKWTALPPELSAQMQTVLTETFRPQIGKGTVVADGRIYPDEILINVSLNEPGLLKHAGWLISITYQVPKDNVLKLLHLGMDAAGALFEQMLSSEDDADFPRLWQKVDFEKREIYVQYTTVNTALEAEADRLLGETDGDDLARGDWSEGIGPEHIKASLGLDPDEDDGAN